MQEHSIIDEIIALKTLRIQKVWELFHSTVVMEGYCPFHKRLFLVFDTNQKTRTLHVQKERPQGVKTSSPFSALLKKYLTDQFIKFVRIDEEGQALKANFTHEGRSFALIFELFLHYKMGIFRELLLLGSFPKNQAPLFRSGSLMPIEKKLDLIKNFARAEHYQKENLHFHQNALFKSRMVDINRQLKKKSLLLKNLQDDLDKSNRNLALLHDAELLRNNLHLIKRGMKEAHLIDYSTHPPAKKTLTLDPRLSPSESIEKIFSKIKRAKRGIGIISRRMDEVKIDLAALQERQHTLEAAGLASINFNEVEEKIIDEIKTKKLSSKRLPYRSFLSSDRIKIFVGKSAKDSDDMTLHYGNGNEWWLHARDATGAHVLVKNNAESLPHNTFLEAAMLAGHFSKNKLDRRVSVQYTRQKYVRKPKGLPPGKVLITQEKNFDVEMDTKIIESLLKREEKD